VTELADALERLRERFRDRAARELSDLRRWSAEPAAHESEIRALVHRLAGAAGTFGFQRLSDVAAKAEDALVTTAADQSEAIEAVIEELERVGRRP
jgi:HPt (histidine-containing phosphotransfer) domain-containing protein